MREFISLNLMLYHDELYHQAKVVWKVRGLKRLRSIIIRILVSYLEVTVVNRCKLDSPRFPTVKAFNICAPIIICNNVFRSFFANQYHFETYKESKIPKHPSRIAVLTPEMHKYCIVIKRTGRRVNKIVFRSTLKQIKANTCIGIVYVSQMKMLSVNTSVITSRVLRKSWR